MPEICRFYGIIIRIVERGAHDELLAQNGLYAQLYETQLNGEKV